MAKIKAAYAAEMFEEIIGWPYVSPGTNDRNGIDCSGAWVRVYREFGISIDHGSNSQYRKFCSRTGEINGIGDLCIGMAVFKVREWSTDQAKHRDYGTAPGNVYHVGCVTSVNPLRIVHATPDFAKVDASLGNWRFWGALKQVDYGESIPVSTDDQPLEESTPVKRASPGEGQAMVVTTTSGLRLRKQPNTSSAVIKEMPRATIVNVLSKEGNWAYVRWDVRPGLYHVGWCSIGEGGTPYLEFG